MERTAGREHLRWACGHRALGIKVQLRALDYDSEPAVQSGAQSWSCGRQSCGVAGYVCELRQAGQVAPTRCWGAGWRRALCHHRVRLLVPFCPSLGPDPQFPVLWSGADGGLWPAFLGLPGADGRMEAAQLLWGVSSAGPDLTERPSRSLPCCLAPLPWKLTGFQRARRKAEPGLPRNACCSAWATTPTRNGKPRRGQQAGPR